MAFGAISFRSGDRIRALPQPDGYHDFTVDRHLLETSANAARLAGRVARPDLLVVAALLHDIGKGSGGDHVAAGVDLVRRIGERIGFVRDDVSTLVSLVTHHLLLRDVATRRDIDDPATVEHVARAVGTIEVLQLLAALTEADGIATGAAAWDPWKAELVGRLVDHVAHRLDGSTRATAVPASFPSDQLLVRLAAGGRHLEARDGVLTVMTADQPGIFSRVAGVLALHGLDVLAAGAHSTDEGRALAEFRVIDPFRDETPWDRILADLELALEGRLAIQARLSERARTYARAGSHDPTAPVVTVGFDHDASADATVIDVQTADGIGVLYRITRALAELDLDIRSARVQTLGSTVHDAFYVRDRHGKIDRPAHARRDRACDRPQLDPIGGIVLTRRRRRARPSVSASGGPGRAPRPSRRRSSPSARRRRPGRRSCPPAPSPPTPRSSPWGRNRSCTRRRGRSRSSP